MKPKLRNLIFVFSRFFFLVGNIVAYKCIPAVN
jgi:hypothetical protein